MVPTSSILDPPTAQAGGIPGSLGRATLGGLTALRRRDRCALAVCPTATYQRWTCGLRLVTARRGSRQGRRHHPHLLLSGAARSPLPSGSTPRGACQIGSVPQSLICGGSAIAPAAPCSPRPSRLLHATCGGCGRDTL